jgi:hypothetical protein
LGPKYVAHGSLIFRAPYENAKPRFRLQHSHHSVIAKGQRARWVPGAIAQRVEPILIPGGNGVALMVRVNFLATGYQETWEPDEDFIVGAKTFYDI